MTRNFLKAFSFSFLLLISAANSYAEGEYKSDAASADDRAEQGKEMRGNFSAEDLDAMKQSQLLDNLANPNYQASEYAVYYFVQKGENSVAPLLGYMKHHDDDDRVVSACIYTLGRVGPNAGRSVPFLIKYLSHKNYEIRKTTIAALGKIGKASDPAVPEIAKYLESDDQWTRDTALRALKDIHTPQSLSVAEQYENKIKLSEQRKNLGIMENGNADPNFVGPPERPAIATTAPVSIK